MQRLLGIRAWKLGMEIGIWDNCESSVVGNWVFGNCEVGIWELGFGDWEQGKGGWGSRSEVWELGYANRELEIRGFED